MATTVANTSSIRNNKNNHHHNTNSKHGINPCTCSSVELVLYLLHQRFEQDEMATAQFLLEAISQLPHADSIREEIMNTSIHDIDTDNNNNNNNNNSAHESIIIAPTRVQEEVASEGVKVGCVGVTVIDTALKKCKNGVQPWKSPNDIGASLLPENNNEDDDDNNNNTPSVTVVASHPRTKFNIVFGTKGIRCTDTKNESLYITQAPKQIVIFPKPDDCRSQKKQMNQLVLLVFSEPVPYKNKLLSQICWQLPLTSFYQNHKNNIIDENHIHPSNSTTCTSETITLEWIDLLTTSLQFPVSDVVRVFHPSNNNSCINNNNNIFTSYQDTKTSSTVAGMPFVSCYYGVQDGVLFPLKEGLLFYKPPLYLPRSDLHALDCCGSNRYLTLTIQLDQKNTNQINTKNNLTIEFTNIHKQEEEGLRQYIYNTLVPAMQRDVEDIDSDRNTSTPMEQNHNCNETDVKDCNIPVRNSRKRQAAIQAERINKQQMQHQSSNRKNNKPKENGGDDIEEEDDDDEEEEDDDDKIVKEDEEENDADFDEEATETESEESDVAEQEEYDS